MTIAYETIKNSSIEVLAQQIEYLENLDWDNLHPYPKKWYTVHYDELLAYCKEQLKIKIEEQLIKTQNVISIRSDRKYRTSYKATVTDVFYREDYLICTVDTFDFGVEECLATKISIIMA